MTLLPEYQGIMARRDGSTSASATAGIILGIISVVFNIIGIVVWMTMLASAGGPMGPMGPGGAPPFGP